MAGALERHTPVAQVPQVSERVAPQLSTRVKLPHRPAHSVWFVCATQPHTLAVPPPPHVPEPLHVPQVTV